jgi:glycerol kinase
MEKFRMKYILTLDQGTNSSRAVLFDHSGKIKSIAQQKGKKGGENSIFDLE